MKKYLILFIGVFIVTSSFSQTNTISCTNQDYFKTIQKMNANGVVETFYTLKDNIEDGDYDFYLAHNPSKKYMSGKIVNGKKEGIWIEYYKSGELKSETNYKNGLANGKQTIYYKNGNIKEERNFKDDVISGIRKYYDKEGKLTSTLEFKNGKIIKK